MIIKRIELTNYCQHANRVVDISGNLIAVVGHNGCGKSNFLGAMQFALTGEQPGKNKADLVHWGAKDGSVILGFEQDGKPGRIERYAGSNKVTLDYDGVTTTGITNVAKVLEERLHIDKDLIRQSVFVRQTEIDTIISAKTDKRDREVAFQKLLGIDAAKIHKNLTDWVYAAEKPVSYDVQLTDASLRIGETEERLVNLDKEVTDAENELKSFGDVDDSNSVNYQKGVAAIASVLEAKSRLASCMSSLTEAENNLKRVKASIPDAGEDPKIDVMTLVEEKAALQGELRLHSIVKDMQAKLDEAEYELSRAVSAKHPEDAEITEIERKIEAYRADIAALQRDIAMHRKALGTLTGGESVCPVCGKPLDAGMVERMRNELTELESNLAATQRDMDSSVISRNVLLTSKAEYDKSVSSATTNRDIAKTALARQELPSVAEKVAQDAVTKIEADIRRQEEYNSTIAGGKRALQDADLKLSVAKSAADDAASRLAVSESEAIRLCGQEASADWTQAKDAMESLITETDKRRNRLTELKMRLATTCATRDEVVRTLGTLNKTYATLKEDQARQDVLAKKLATLDRVRDWFHYANGPRVLVTQVLGALTDDVNRFLGNFTAPFVVIPDQDQVGFRIEFTDGRTRPEDPPGTDVLSGGERVQLAVAFRLAIYGMFAGKLGLLSLDEPTAYLDDGNVDRFGVLLTKVKEIARNMGTQVFMATHERAVIPHMDSIIDLN